MAGSLNHIVGKDGHFKMGLIENLGDAHEALHECFEIIRVLTGGNVDTVNAACDTLEFPRIEVPMRPSEWDVDGLED